jgi:hypothetical protein
VESLKLDTFTIPEYNVAENSPTELYFKEIVRGCTFKKTIGVILTIGVSEKYTANFGFVIDIFMESTAVPDSFIIPEIFTEIGV